MRQRNATKPQVAIWGTKQAIHYTRDHSVDDALKQMGWLQGAIWSNAHVREAVTAMKEKRAAQFPAGAGSCCFDSHQAREIASCSAAARPLVVQQDHIKDPAPMV